MSILLTMMTGLGSAIFFVWGSSLASAPLKIAVETEPGQLRIAWNPAAAAGRALVEIQDGSKRITIPIAGALVNICYTPTSPNVAVRLLGSKNDEFEAHLEVPRLLSAAAAPSVAEVRTRFDRTESELRKLRAEVANGYRRVEALEVSTDRLSRSLASGMIPRTETTMQRFWRD
jgi:hypothetical protein